MFKSVLILLVACTFVSFVSAGAPADTNQKKTIVTFYQPGHMQVLETKSGSCWTGSIAVQRTDAYRCMTGNTILDPCFISGKKTVACPTDVLRDRGTVMNLTAPLPSSADQAGGDNVWAFELWSGGFCQMGTGTIIPGYPFYCSAPPVCSAPKLSSNPSLYASTCGEPQRGMTVTSLRVEKVSRIWK